MSAFHDNALLGASGQQGYKISRSVRLRSSASAYLNRTFTTPTSNIKWTWSGWVKRGAIGSSVTNAFIGSALGGAGTYFMFSLNGDALDILQVTSSSVVARLTTTSVYRDPSAWYHIVMVWDSANATSSNRILLYVNGVQVTAFSTATYPSSSLACSFNQSGTNVIGYRNYAGDSYYDGYMTEQHFIDGQALTPSSFGETDTTTGVWKPKKYTGTYGTNGFYLNFSDNSNNTAATIGKDYSGNGNNWTPNNISVTAGVTYDSMLDVPTNYADGGNGRGNYCVFNPLVGTHSNTYSNGNLQVATSTANAAFSHQRATFGLSSGKWYWEITCQATSSAYYIVGITADTVNPDSQYVGQGNSYCYRNDTGQKGNNGTFSSYGATFTTGDIIGVEFDADAGTLVFYKNGTSQGAAFTGISGTYFPAVADLDNNTSRNSTFIANFGQRPFSYTPPTGFVALNTQNLPTPTISNGANYMNASLWTGDASTPRAVVSNLAFSPDLVWTKDRSVGYQHSLQDTVRGTGASKKLYSSLTEAENGANSVYGHINSFDSNGFTVATGSSGAQHVNASGVTYVGWSWKAGGASSSNTSGSITSTVSAGATQGFSVVTWTGTGANATVGHGLGVAPKMIIVKNRSITSDWRVYTAMMGATGALDLNSTIAFYTGSNLWNNTSPTSSVFTVSTNTNTNGSGNSLVAYCFAEVAGYSKFGSYTGNGSTDGTFVYLGFRPRWVMVKRTDTTSNWVIVDTSRNVYNPQDLNLYPNLSAAEDDYTTTYPFDMLSNGIKFRANYANVNASGGTYIYAAFAENPTKFALAR